jgi:glycosyltransferase involved in cell wall biosynthesis
MKFGIQVMHTSQYYWPYVGGAEKYCQAISEGIAGKAISVDVYTTDVISVSPKTFSDKSQDRHSGVKIRRIRTFPVINDLYGNKALNQGISASIGLFNQMDTRLSWPLTVPLRAISSAVPHALPMLLKSAKEHDLVGCFNIITGMTANMYLVTRVTRKPLVIFPMFHVGLPSYEKLSLYHILKNANAVICSTTFEKDELLKRGVQLSKTFVVHEGIAAPRLDFRKNQELHDVCNPKDEYFVVSYVGRREYDKGYPHVLASIRQLVDRGHKIKLIVSGYGEIGNQTADYKSLIKKNALIDLGVADEQTKFAVLNCNDVLVLPSRAETYPLVFLEAWWLGKPVIGANIGSVASVVRQGIDGFLVTFGDVGGLSSYISKLYADRNLVSSMGQAGQERTKRHFSIQSTIKSITQIYEEVLTKV